MLDPAEYKRAWVAQLNWHKELGHRIVGYGSPAKANTLLCYCGVGPETIEYLVDSTPSKINKFTPGTHIEIRDPSVLEHDDPEVIVILAHNWTQEILAKLQPHIDRGAIIYSQLERVA